MDTRDVNWVDYIRVLASFLVVLVHTCSSTVTQYNVIPIVDWQIGNLYASLSRVAVPLFFMLSGYLLLGKDEPLQDILLKRVRRIIVPLIAWSVFYMFWGSWNTGLDQIIIEHWIKVIVAPVHFHLWFLYALLGLYLCLPVLRLIVRCADKNLLYYVLILWFISVSGLPFLEKVLGASSEIDLALTSGYMGYLLLGHLLGNLLLTRKIFYFAVLSLLLLLVATATGAYMLTLGDDGVLNRYFYNYLSPNVILMAISSFVVLRYFFTQPEKEGGSHNLIKHLSSASFGIYLVHVVFLDVLYNGYLGFVLSPASFYVAYSIPITAMVIFLLSYLQVSLFKKIPLLRDIV
jgi:surface polysaccharide O-acyltransferase-like enzyme